MLTAQANLTTRFFLLLMLTAALLAGACSKKAGLKSPELPAKHWLEEAPGVPVENKSKLESAVPNLYDPKKVFSFEDCVFLTIQQSPALVNSAVDIEIKRLAQTDAVWKYLPEPHMQFTVSNNLTRYNMDNKDTPSDYGQTRFRVGFYAAFPNPMATYFEHQVQTAMVNLAISTHRKAVGKAISKIGEAYLQLQAQQKIVEAQKELLPLGKELVDYWQKVESVDGRQGVSLNLAIQHQRELELRLEQTRMKEIMQRTKLKILAGVEPQQRLEVDTKSADSVLAGFDGHKLTWEDRWPATEDELLLRGQVKLGDYNIMVAWAQYVPTMSIALNNSPPSGQYQPVSGSEDTFLHLTFDFPLIDWGRRYRGVQTARMNKAQAFHELARKRTDYSNQWLQSEQRVALAETELKLAKTRLDTANMQFKEAQISFHEGIVQLPDMANKQEDMVQARIAYINADLDYKLAQLEWMSLSNSLAQRFLGLPAKEVL
ncbi:TolC family protein [Desulfovibrio desulfuricans]|uniref:TolC family protein n=1 Tax=Desulfovibrio desulfuricans TaxID=876 RepID=UPI0035B30F2D